MRRTVTAIVVGLTGTVAWLTVPSPEVRAQQPTAQQRLLTFSSDIQPILSRHCWSCHGADQRSEFDLRTRLAALKGGRRGEAIVPGDSEASRLYRRIAGFEQPSMPPDGSLSSAEISAIRTWIDQGAHWSTGTATTVVETTDLPNSDVEDSSANDRDYWAFKLPMQAAVPLFPELEHPVDRFLEQARYDQGLTAGPRADRRTLLRRASLDLIGLPPTPAETAQFLADTERGAWERLIDRLLASPHYGERWGRHWLDVARYADSTGYEQDFDRPNAWRYRDYVIAAFNKDKPYNLFVKEQVAGDELDYTTDETRIATGFLRAGPRVQFREKDNPERRHDYLDDVLATIGRGMLGLTVHCARCHDHKFDPIPQADYYSLQASIFGYVETEHPLLSRGDAEVYARTNAEISARQQPLRDEITQLEAPYREQLKLQQLRQRFPENVQRAALKPAAERTRGEQLLATQVLSINVPREQLDEALRPEDRVQRQQLVDQIAAIEQQRPAQVPVAEIVTDGDYRYAPDGPGDEVIGCPECRVMPDTSGSFLHDGVGSYETPPSHFLVRGDPFRKGTETAPGFVTVATYGNPPTEIPRANGRTSGRRLALAEWLGSPQNPLTARVLVNRLWHHHFGRGIFGTLDNLGLMGTPPTHPELLDWLAVEFMHRGWSIKEMQRLIMTSQAYQMTSVFENAENVVNDPQNQLLWRYRLQRLEAEILRDAVMMVSGGLDLTVGGPPVFPYIPEEILRSSPAPYGRWDNQPDGPHAWRRSVYVYRRRSLGLPFFDTFDLPDQNVTAAARNVSTVPTQALTLMNNPFVLRQAELFAERLKQTAPSDPRRQIELAYEIALTRQPTTAEMVLARKLVDQQSLVDLAHVMFNLNEFLYIR